MTRFAAVETAITTLRGQADALEAWLRSQAANDAAPAPLPPTVTERAIPAPPNPGGGLQNPAVFYDRLKASNVVMGPRLTSDQVRGTNALLKIGAGRLPVGWMAYVLATAYHETGHVMVPVKERGSGDKDGDGLDDYLEKYDTGRLASVLGNTPEADGDGVLYAGRGQVQLTGLANYRKATTRLQALGILRPDESLVETPDLALDPLIGSAICIFGMIEGWFTGKSLNHYIAATGTLAQFTNARRIINGTDRAALIASYAVAFQAALEAGGWK